MSQEFAVIEARELRQQFLSWRRRFLFWKVLGSINLFVCFLFVAAIAIFAIDYTFAIPWALRVAILATLLAAVAVFASRILRFLYHPPKFATLARSIQTQHTGKRSNLIAAGMLLDESPDLSGNDRSVAMALRHARKQIYDWNWQASIDRAKPLSWMIAFILLFIASLLLWNRGPRDVISQRWFSLLSNQAASESTLEFLNPPSSVVVGQSIHLHIKHSGPVKPESLSLDIQGSVGQVGRLQDNAANISTFEISNIQSPLRIQARAAAFARSGYLEIALRDRPKVLSHEFVITPPSYLKQSAYRSNKSDLSITQNSKALLNVSLSDSVPQLQLKAVADSGHETSLVGRAIQSGVEFDLSSLADLETFSKTFNSASGSVHYRLGLFAQEHAQDSFDLAYGLALQVQADAPPSFSILNPPQIKSPLTLSEIGEHFKASVTDDYGIDSVNMVINGISAAVAKADQSSIENRHLYQRDQNVSDKSMLRSFSVDQVLKREDIIAKWPTCSAIDCSLIATDIAGQQATSTTVRLLLHKKESQQSQALDAIGRVVQLQRQLQKQTEQAMRGEELSPQQREQLASQQQAIREKWQQANESEQKKSPKQEKSVNSIDQLMQASQNNLKDGKLIESSSIQSGILHRLNELASDLQKDAKTDRSVDAVKNLENQISKWSQQQSHVSEAIKERLDDASEPQALENAQTEEAKLQQEIQKQLDTLEESSPFAWPLSQANKSIARANAKLQRNMIDASTLADAQNAADMLKSLADNIVNESKPTNNQAAPEETAEDKGDQSTSSAIHELEIIQSLQNRLHDRLLSVQGNQASANESSLATIRSIAQSQNELALRIKKLAQSLSER